MATRDELIGLDEYLQREPTSILDEEVCEECETPITGEGYCRCMQPDLDSEIEAFDSRAEREINDWKSQEDR